jgi:SAM domain (Sterile alpha motif)
VGNRIDLSVLPDVTDQDLEKLGVVLGDRRKMLRAIANLDNTPPTTAPATAQPIAVTTGCVNGRTEAPARDRQGPGYQTKGSTA